MDVPIGSRSEGSEALRCPTRSPGCGQAYNRVVTEAEPPRSTAT